MIDARASGGAYTRVFVNGVEFSKHAQPHKAAERAYDVALDALRQAIIPFPVIYTSGDGRIYYEPDPAVGIEVIPRPSAPVVSDGGVDLIDFIQGNTSEPPRNPVALVGDFWTVLLQFAETCKRDWLLHRLYFRLQDSVELWAGVGWRGYTLLFYHRDRTALRIGGTA